MRPFLPLLVLLVLASASAAGAAQSPRGGHFARAPRPVRSVTFDLATGTWTRGAAPVNRSAATVADFVNLDLGGFVGVDSGGGVCEWFEAGVKGTGTGATAGVVNDSDLMNSIVFAYCSAALSPGSGGPGGSVKLGFYEGYTTWGGASTTAVAVLTLTGLPGNSRSSSFFGGFNCYFIRVVFGGLVCFADGPIGYSWKFLDLGTGVINPIGASLAATWPFLACVGSCSSGVPLSCTATDGQGMDGIIDRYCPPGIPPPICTMPSVGISMAIEEVVDSPAGLGAFNSSTHPNPDTLTSVPAIVGQPWSVSLTLGLARSPSTWVCYLGSGAVSPPTGQAIPRFSGGLNFGGSKAGRMLLCALDTSGFSCLGTHTGVSGSSSSACTGVTIPKQFGLVCNPWCAQAVVLGAVPGAGNARLSSAVAGVVGTN